VTSSRSGASGTARAILLKGLYALYEAAGAHVYTDSDEMARRLAMDDELVEMAAAELRMR
jgi:hypothetical protein